MSNKYSHDHCPSRRKFVGNCIKYGSALSLAASIPFITSCSTDTKPASTSATEIQSSKTKSQFPILDKNPASAEVNQNIVAKAQTGDPYDLTKRAIDALGGMDKFVTNGERVMILPNMAWDRTPEQAANTHPDVVKAVVEMCKKAGAADIGVFCFPCHAAQSVYKKSGIAEVAEKAGAKIYFVDPSRDFTPIDINGTNIKTMGIYSRLLKADRFINIPIAKQHSLAKYTMCMKNLLGAVEDRPIFHKNINQDLADLSMILQPDLNILDATRILVKNGPTGGSLADVHKPEMVFAGANPVSVDSVGIELFGKTPDLLRCLPIARDLGRGKYGSDVLEIREA